MRGIVSVSDKTGLDRLGRGHLVAGRPGILDLDGGQPRSKGAVPSQMVQRKLHRLSARAEGAHPVLVVTPTGQGGPNTPRAYLYSHGVH